MLTNRNVGRHHQAMTRSTSGAAQAAARSHSTLENWLRAQGSANTRAAYRSDFTMFGSWCSHQGAIPLAADTATLAAFQAARIAAGDSPLTIRRRMSALSSFYCFAVEQHVVAVNPALGVRRPKVAADGPSPTAQLSEAAVAACRAAAAALDPRLEALVGLLVCDGLKVAEALALDIDDVSGRAPATAVAVWRRGAGRGRCRPSLLVGEVDFAGAGTSSAQAGEDHRPGSTRPGASREPGPGERWKPRASPCQLPVVRGAHRLQRLLSLLVGRLEPAVATSTSLGSDSTTVGPARV